MKLGRRAALKAGAGLGVVALGAPAIVQAQAAVKLPLATVWPDGNFHTVNAKRYADEVKAATSGAVEIDVKSGGQLGFKGPEQLRAVRDGLVPMADILKLITKEQFRPRTSIGCAASFPPTRSSGRSTRRRHSSSSPTPTSPRARRTRTATRRFTPRSRRIRR